MIVQFDPEWGKNEKNISNSDKRQKEVIEKFTPWRISKRKNMIIRKPTAEETGGPDRKRHSNCASLDSLCS